MAPAFFINKLIAFVKLVAVEPVPTKKHGTDCHIQKKRWILSCAREFIQNTRTLWTDGLQMNEHRGPSLPADTTLPLPVSPRPQVIFGMTLAMQQQE